MTLHEKLVYALNAPLRKNIGKKAKFKSTVISSSGTVQFRKGAEVLIYEVDCAMYRIKQLPTAEKVHGLFRPELLEIQ